MKVDEAARRWARTWEQGWNDRDVEAIVALYADGAVFSSEPFREPYMEPGRPTPAAARLVAIASAR